MLKKLALGFALLLVVGGGALFWVWRQATALPQWYTQQSAQERAQQEADPDAQGAPAPQWIAVDPQGNRVDDIDPVPLVAQPPREAAEPATSGTPQRRPDPRPQRNKQEKRPQRREIRGFHRRAIKGRSGGGNVQQSKAIKASRATLEDGTLEVGLIVDLSKFPKEKLKGSSRARLDRAIANFPGLTDRDVWVGVKDRPRTLDGYLQLSPDAQVRVGSLTYSLSSAAKRLGMSPTQLRAELNRELRRLGLVDPGA